jgi:glycosyltransferase involved in cell wall biosynthesis
MRILHIIGTVDLAAGGPSQAIRNIIRNRPAGYRAEVATLDTPGLPFLNDLPFPVHPLGTGSWYSPKLIPWLKANRDRFDGVIVHGVWGFNGLAALLAIAGHKPYLVFTHGMLDPYFKHRYPFKHLKKWPYWLLVEYWLLRRASRVLFTTQRESELATESFWLWRWNPLVISYGTDPQIPSPEKLLPALYEQCPELQQQDTPRSYLLYLSRIHPKKGCDLLLQAFVTVAPAHPNLHLIMAGPDPTNLLPSLQKIAADANLGDRVHWPGMLKGEAKWGAFQLCDAFILPSHQENFGIAVAEALAAGRPVLISDQVNIAPEILADGCGLVEPDTLESTTRLLQRWLALTPQQRESMRQQARLTFDNRYDMRKNSALILRTFEQLVPHPIADEAH